MPAAFLVAGTIVAALHSGAAVLCAFSPGADRLAGFFAGCAVATAATTCLLYLLLRRAGPADGGGGRGGPGTVPDRPPPAWWPAFEDEFRRYADRGEPTSV